MPRSASTTMNSFAPPLRSLRYQNFVLLANHSGVTWDLYIPSSRAPKRSPPPRTCSKCTQTYLASSLKPPPLPVLFLEKEENRGRARARGAGRLTASAHAAQPPGRRRNEVLQQNEREHQHSHHDARPPTV